MSITMSQLSMQGYKRIKMQYVALAGGIALAVAAAIGAASIGGDSKPASGRASASPAAVAAPAASTPRLVFYVVESVEARSHLEAMLATDEMARIESYGGGSHVMYHVLVADSPEAERRAMQQIAEDTEFGTFTVDYVEMPPGP